MRVVRLNVGPMDNNTYLVVDEASQEAAVVDPSFGSLDAVIRYEDLHPAPSGSARTLRWIVDTHAHLDHVVENAAFARRSGAAVALHVDDLPLLRSMEEQAAWFGIETPPMVEPAVLLRDGDTIPLGQSAMTVLHTPGHSPGGVCLLGQGWVIVGDVVFAGSVGRTDLPGGSMQVLLDSIGTRLLTLPDGTIVYPGHGPETTIGCERRTNPFLIGM